MPIKCYESGLGREYPPADWRQFFWTEAYLKENSFDLHLHSTASDGSQSPAKLAHELIERGLQDFILTDHDTIAGQAEFAASLKDLGYPKKVIYGVELSVVIPEEETPGNTTQDENFYTEGEEVHLLAYFDHSSMQRFSPFLEQARKERERRNTAMLKRIQDLGYALSEEDLAALNPGSEQEENFVLGRVHMAKALVQKGYFDSIDQAFKDFLYEGKPAYVARRRPSINFAIEAIHEAGGLAVLAHPAEYGWFKEPYFAKVSAYAWRKLAALAELGLDGLEVWHGDASPEIQVQASLIALALRLFRTGGSDYHGSNRTRELFRPGSVELPPEILVTAACLFKGDRVLLGRRPAKSFMGGYWEFPGGKVEAGESPRSALCRELKEELDLDLTLADLPLEPAYAVPWHYEGLRVNLIFYAFDCPANQSLKALEHEALAFYEQKELAGVRVLPANRALIKYLFHPTGKSHSPQQEVGKLPGGAE